MLNMKCLFLIILGSLPFSESFTELSYEKILNNINNGTRQKLSSSCRSDLSSINMFTPTYWQMVDASSRLPSGIAKGNVMPMGNYDECLEIKNMETKFCRGSIRLDPLFLLQWTTIIPVDKDVIGVLTEFAQESKNNGLGLYFCVLKSCSTQDLNIIFPHYLRFNDTQCIPKNSSTELDTLAITAILIFVLIGIIILVSTVYDIYLKYNNLAPIYSAVIAFSLYTNSKELFRVGQSQQLRCLNGIKSLSMAWVVLGHVYLAYAFVPLDNYLELYKYLKTSFSQHVSGATASVDTFLVVAGFLTIYNFLTIMDKGKTINIPLLYLRRYLRRTIPFAAMILAHAALFNYLGSGPVWQKTDTILSKACKEYWWSALLHIQNYANSEEVCVPPSWYLSVDMQLFLISPIILFLIRQRPFLGYICLSMASLISIITSFLISWFYKLEAQPRASVNINLDDYMKYYYMPTHTRMVPYLFGIMLGYFVYSLQATKEKYNLNRVLVICGWMTSIGLVVICMYSGHRLQTTEYNRLGSSVYIALMRPLWSLAVCWIIFACLTGYGGLVNVFLSYSFFQFSSKLCYSVYLIHYSFIFMNNFATRKPLHFSDYNALHKFFGDFAFCVGLAILWTLIFEYPVNVLEKVFITTKDDKTEKKSLLA